MLKLLSLFKSNLPDYVKVSKHDGTKSVDGEKFVQNPGVQRQIREWAKDTESTA